MFKHVIIKLLKTTNRTLFISPWLIVQKSKNKEPSHCDHTTQEVLTTNSKYQRTFELRNNSKDILNKRRRKCHKFWCCDQDLVLLHGEDKRNCLMDNKLEKDWNREMVMNQN